jgi:hypothetical protein
MACESEFRAKQEAERLYGVGSPQFNEAMGKYLRCIGAVQDARDGWAADRDEILMERMGWLRDFSESVLGQIDVPPGPDFDKRNIDLRNKIFGDAKTALIFSERIEQAFRESGIALEDNETFACFVYVRERPSDVSEVIAPTFLASHPEVRSLLNIIMAPKPMRQVLEGLGQGEYAEAKPS